MKRYGAVVIFPPGMSKEEAGFVLAGMVVMGHIENPARPAIKNQAGKEVYPAHNGVDEYDDEFGGPVWYVP